MSFPNVIYGEYGDEKVTGTTKLHELGMKMELPDGRAFRYARVSATAMVVGKLYIGPGEEANTSLSSATLAPAGTNSAGARSVVLTIAGTALVANVFDDGYLTVASSIGADRGRSYKIASNNSCAIAGTTTIVFAGNDELITTWDSSTKVGIRKSPYDEVLLTLGADTSSLNTFAGVSAASAAASSYVWLQRRGPATVLVDNTDIVVGQGVTASTTVAGAVADVSDTATDEPYQTKYVIGTNISGGTASVAANTEYALIDLCIE